MPSAVDGVGRHPCTGVRIIKNRGRSGFRALRGNAIEIVLGEKDVAVFREERGRHALSGDERARVRTVVNARGAARGTARFEKRERRVRGLGG